MADFDFLSGGGEMGALMRAHDWSRTTLGDPGRWPQSLRTVVRLMLNTGHPMYIFWGAQGSCLYNDAYRQSIGPERHPGSLGRPAIEVWEEIWPIIGPQFEQVMTGGGPTWHENALVPITRNGALEDVYWTYSYSPIDDEGAPGGIGGVLVTCTETTEQVEQARQMTEQQARQQALFSQMPGFVGVLTGPDHVYEYVNDAYLTIGGPRDYIGRSVRQVFPELAGQGFYELLDQVYATGQRFVARAVPIHLDVEDSDRFIDLLYEPIRDARGAVTGVFVGGYDVTESYRTAEALRALNADLERRVIERTQARGLTWQVSPDLLGALNPQGYFETSNPAWMTLLGWSEAEVAATSIFDLLHPDDVERTRVGFELTQIGQPAIRFPNRYRCKDGSYRWISWTGVFEDGMIYCSGRDITEEKAAEAELLQAQEALRQSQKMEAVGQLTGGLAHDFNNLLAGISGSLEILQQRIGEGRVGEASRYIDLALTSAHRAAALTQRLLAFSRRQTLDPKPVDANALVTGIEDLIRRTVGPAIVVKSQREPHLWLTQVDPSQLENTLLNLVINARDAMPDGGCITVTTANIRLEPAAAKTLAVQPGPYVSLCLTDTGEGMTSEVIERAFDPFFTTKPLGQGTGLGLSMVHGFARQSGGQVRIESELGRGTTVCLYLPRFEGALDADDASAEPAAGDLGQGETVMVVDDEEIVRMLIVDVLEEAGYRVLEAADGPSALEILRSDARIDLLVTDVGLPGGLNGRQVADAARADRPDLKVLFVTGYAENAVVGGGKMDAGMQVITKPFAMAALGARVREIIEG